MSSIASVRVVVPPDACGIVVAGNPGTPVVPVVSQVGSVDLTTLTYGGGGTVDGRTVIANGVTCTFVAPANAAAIVSQLNSALGNGLGSASLNGSNELVLAAGLTGGNALAALGIAVPASSSRVYQGGVTFQNLDAANGIFLMATGALVTGYFLKAGGSLTLPPVDISQFTAFAPTGSPKLNWIGVDLV